MQTRKLGTQRPRHFEHWKTITNIRLYSSKTRKLIKSTAFSKCSNYKNEKKNKTSNSRQFENSKNRNLGIGHIYQHGTCVQFCGCHPDHLILSKGRSPLTRWQLPNPHALRGASPNSQPSRPLGQAKRPGLPGLATARARIAILLDTKVGKLENI